MHTRPAERCLETEAAKRALAAGGAANVARASGSDRRQATAAAISRRAMDGERRAAIGPQGLCFSARSGKETEHLGQNWLEPFR
mmetsp:Transcript_65444/g.151887  ORF Transcript_65444/g.151887 Transcript_65444/m.151887 type:complete len:84 (+) Transcript_65444:788-1039(+)